MESSATPTKRLLTEEDRNSLVASRTPYNSFLSNDLTARLQNIGSRVRKTVTEGYATHKLGSVPPTPYPSPEKPRVTTNTPKAKVIFRSANDTLFDVFSTPTCAPTSPSPSPRKRGHAELEEEEEETFEVNADLDVGMESDNESVTFVMTPSPSRPIKPLKKLSTPHLNSSVHAILHGHVASESTDPFVMQPACQTSDNFREMDMFNQDF